MPTLGAATTGIGVVLTHRKPELTSAAVGRRPSQTPLVDTRQSRHASHRSPDGRAILAGALVCHHHRTLGAQLGIGDQAMPSD